MGTLLYGEFMLWHPLLQQNIREGMAKALVRANDPTK